MPQMTPRDRKTTDQTIDLLRQTAINNIKTAVSYLQAAQTCLEGEVTWEVEKMLAEVGQQVMLAGGNARAALLARIVLKSIDGCIEEHNENKNG
jgi:hypothetical protein